MQIRIDPANPTTPELTAAAHALAAQLRDLGFAVGETEEPAADAARLRVVLAQVDVDPAHGEVALADPTTMLEAALRALPLDFEALPLLIEGESKVLRQWTDGVVVTRLKPTVYSYSMNRSGAVPGTDDSRLRFTATLFRRMAALPPQAGIRLQNAFLTARDTPAGPLLIERRVETCNLEVRVKRYHIGSPLHRYRFTEQYPSLQAGGPIGRWSRFDQPLVCFDWRHPLTDDAGTRLADEPISDDYAAVWMENVPNAKELARQTFLWMEGLFEAGGLRLVDICFFVDRSGRMIYGEVSPDCMRVRRLDEDLDRAAPGAKDIWRAGGSPEALLANYEDIYRRVFG